MNSQKGIGAVALIVILAVVAAVGVGVYLLSSNNSTQETVVVEEEMMNTSPAPTNTTDQPTGTESASDAVTIDITGKNFEFSQDEIRVKQGQQVTINFTSESGFHDWVVDEFDAATSQVNTGGETSVTFVADQVGEFEYYCSVGNHRQMGMVGTLIVE